MIRNKSVQTFVSSHTHVVVTKLQDSKTLSSNVSAKAQTLRPITDVRLPAIGGARKL